MMIDNYYKNILKGGIMAEKLYEKDQYQDEFTANIIDITAKEGKYHVKLDRTYFYPKGGGQPSDQGKINGLDVEYVYKKDEDIFHVLDEKPSKVKDIKCNIDWQRRYDFMQQHTGQHLLSAVLKNDYDINTVGFSLSASNLRIDLDKQLSCQQLKQIEEKTNQYIYKAIDIESLYPDQTTLGELNLRKEPAVDQNIRVIKIGNIDFSPCGGTHLKNTAELGMIKIIDVENYKGGLRLEFVCGKRALKDYDLKNEICLQLRDILSVPEQEILKEVKRHQKAINTHKDRISTLDKELMNYKAEALKKSADRVNGILIVKKLWTDLSYDNVQLVANILCNQANIICIFAHRQKETARLLIARSENIKAIDASEVINEPLRCIKGRGGGNKLNAQGGGNQIDKILDALNLAYQTVKEQL